MRRQLPNWGWFLLFCINNRHASLRVVRLCVTSLGRRIQGIDIPGGELGTAPVDVLAFVSWLEEHEEESQGVNPYRARGVLGDLIPTLRGCRRLPEK